MREEEEERSWFARWEEQLPSPEELMPLSQTLITPDLALAFDIPTHHPSPTPTPSTSRHHQNHQPPPPPPSSSSQQHQGGEYEAGDAGNGGGGAGGGGEEPARTLKRPRLVWTPQLHKRFVDAVAHLGIKNAVPKTIMQLMSVDGLTRENVASHLQKYRLYLKRVQGLSNPSSSSSPPGGPVSAADAADHQLFATAPVPPHFLARGGPADPFGPPPPPYSPMAALQHHQQMAVVQQHQQYYHQRHVSHFGSPPGHAGGFDHTGFLSRAMPQTGMHRIVGPPTGIGMVQPPPPPPAASYIEDLESGTGGGGGRRVLTLFPTGDD